MADQDPIYAKSHDAASWTADDGSIVNDLLTKFTDDNISSQGKKIGKSPDDILRCEWANLLNASVGDTFTVHFSSSTTVATWACLAYSTATAVTETAKLTYTISGGTPCVFTITQAFLDELHDLGSNNCAVRFTEDGGISGDVEVTEVQADLTISAGGAGPVVAQGATATGTGNIAFTTSFVSQWELLNMTIKFSADAQNDVLLTLDAGAGSDYDTQLVALTAAGLTRIFYDPKEDNRRMIFSQGDELLVSWTNPASLTYGLRIVIRRLDVSKEKFLNV